MAPAIDAAAEATTAKQNADAAANACNTATGLANTAAVLANQKATLVQTATDAANTATSTATDAANTAINRVMMYDCSAKGTIPFATLDLAIAAVPLAYQKGGLHIKFVDTASNKYNTYFLMTPTWSTATADWLYSYENSEYVNNIVSEVGISDYEEYDPSITYEIGAIRTYQGKLYKCISDIISPEQFNNSNWVETSVNEIITNSLTKKLDSSKINVLSEDEYTALTTKEEGKIYFIYS